MDPISISRRTLLRLSLVGTAGVGLAACGSSGPDKASDSGGSTGSATYWYLTGQPG